MHLFVTYADIAVRISTVRYAYLQSYTRIPPSAGMSVCYTIPYMVSYSDH